MKLLLFTKMFKARIRESPFISPQDAKRGFSFNLSNRKEKPEKKSSQSSPFLSLFYPSNSRLSLCLPLNSESLMSPFIHRFHLFFLNSSLSIPFSSSNGPWFWIQIGQSPRLCWNQPCPLTSDLCHSPACSFARLLCLSFGLASFCSLSDLFLSLPSHPRLACFPFLSWPHSSPPFPLQSVFFSLSVLKTKETQSKRRPFLAFWAFTSLFVQNAEIVCVLVHLQSLWAFMGLSSLGF